MVDFNKNPAGLNYDRVLIEAAKCQERQRGIPRSPTPTTRPPDHPLPPHIGPYRILARLGEGGMGTVYLAEDPNPSRRVALKVIKAGRDSKSVIARFDIEKQAMALMDHPSIARVFAAGTTDVGQPYFSMEFVSGLKITDYCDRHRLPIAGRLRLFIAVCDAVQHAHYKGIIHRDIKPSNILVTGANGASIPKIIDFGVAKAVGQQLTDMTLMTEEGQLIGTPTYMSPEQAELTGREIDTRTDIYSLGVVLYELLTGTLPFDLKTLTRGTVDELRRLIREVDPPKPSTKLGLLTVADEQSSTTVARNRGSNLTSLSRSLRGELDWITMKALEKEQSRRYSTAHEFAADVMRYLKSEPVLAGPPSVSYRVRKFARRNRVLVSSLTAIFLVSSGAAVFSSLALRRESIARKDAEHEARKAQSALDILENVFRAPMPDVAGYDVKMTDYFDAAVAELEHSQARQPEVEALTRRTLGRTFLALDEFDKAEPQLKLALQLHNDVYGDEHPEVATALCDLAQLAHDRGNYHEALRIGTECLELRKRLFGTNHVETAEALHLLAISNENSGGRPKAIELLREAIRICRSLPQPVPSATARNLRALGGTLADVQQYVESELLLREALELHRHELGESHAEVAIDLTELGLLLKDVGKLAEAEPLLRRSVELRKQLYGPRSRSVGEALVAIGELESALGRHSEAEIAVREALGIYMDFYEEPQVCIANTKLQLAKIVDDSGVSEAAVPIYLDALGQYEQLYGPDSSSVGRARSNYGGCLTRLGRYEEAEHELLAAYQVFSTGGKGASPPAEARVAARLAKLYTEWGRPEAAKRWNEISGQGTETTSQ